MSFSDWAAGLRWRALAKIAALIAFLIAANFLAHALSDTLSFQIRPNNEDLVHRTIMISAAVYSVLLAIPFVPGAEIGLAMIAMLGPPIAFMVYVCTVAGLSLSFIAGRMLPLLGLARLAEDLSFRRTAELLNQIEPLSQKERLAFLTRKAPKGLLPFLLRYRYLALAFALNLPGNLLIGGGGGIALFAGVSRLYSVPGFLATIALAVAPVPLAVLILGSEFLAK